MNLPAAHEANQTIFRQNYQALPYTITEVSLDFALDVRATQVKSRLLCVRQPHVAHGPLVLNGENLQCLALSVDGTPQAIPDDLKTVEIHLGDKKQAMIEVTTQICPEDNSALMGLFLSQGGLFTQCEAQGFRRITLFPDRPDVMARYTVRLEADAAQFPVLLSNGNLIEQGRLPGGRHFARWHDPFAKPSYLFALVAADLALAEKHIQTRSGKTVCLQVWAKAQDLPRTAHAMDSLIASLCWDEATFGLELDLDRFMVVAVSDFNAGAMENKGLNIFNTKYVLADAASATDDDFEAVESVVAHEYFHNWTGNRITCRDWFQLTLKEGLTVFRDQLFTADMLAQAAEPGAATSARAIKRIDDVDRLRASQFPEDAGPMAHPIRPESYQEISNFYTSTVYEKGAEVIRMLHTLLGAEGFRNGFDLYFSYFDGQGVTCDDFIDAMAEANERDLSQFRLWYSQAGTPRVHVQTHWDAQQGHYQLTLSQHTPVTPGQAHKEAFYIPFKLALLDSNGANLPLQLASEAQAGAGERILILNQPTQSWIFVGLKAEPVLSPLRNFSAPVILEYDESDRALAFRMAHDTDPFNQRDAAQRYAERVILALTHSAQNQAPLSVPEAFTQAFQRLANDLKLDAGFRARALSLPSEAYLLERMDPADPQHLRAALIHLYTYLGRALEADWLTLYRTHAVPGAYRYHPGDAGKRALRNTALGYLCAAGSEAGVQLAQAQLQAAQNMTEQHGALLALVNCAQPGVAQTALAHFEATFKDDALPMDKWFRAQSSAWRWHPAAADVLQHVKALTQHPAFSLSNPNKVYALLGGFFYANEAEFHRADGAGYAFWEDIVRSLSAKNPQIAARIARALESWRHYTPAQQALIEPHLRALFEDSSLAADVREIIQKALADNEA